MLIDLRLQPPAELTYTLPLFGQVKAAGPPPPAWLQAAPYDRDAWLVWWDELVSQGEPVSPHLGAMLGLHAYYLEARRIGRSRQPFYAPPHKIKAAGYHLATCGGCAVAAPAARKSQPVYVEPIRVPVRTYTYTALVTPMRITRWLDALLPAAVWAIHHGLKIHTDKREPLTAADVVRINEGFKKARRTAWASQVETIAPT